MPLEPVITALSARFERVRAGLDVGFSDEDFIARLHAARRGNWLSIPSSDIFPFEASQFDAVVLESQAVTREAVKEANRVLKPNGFMFFTVDAKTRKHEGYTVTEIYKIIREGFDIVDVARPSWWRFGFVRWTITVSARKKAWKEQRGLSGKWAAPFIN